MMFEKTGLANAIKERYTMGNRTHFAETVVEETFDEEEV
jgi:hypothetical protein